MRTPAQTNWPVGVIRRGGKGRPDLRAGNGLPGALHQLTEVTLRAAGGSPGAALEVCTQRRAGLARGWGVRGEPIIRTTEQHRSLLAAPPGPLSNIMWYGQHVK